MAGPALYAELNAVRALVAHGLAEVSTASEVGHFWIRSACARLAAIEAVLVDAAGVPLAGVTVLAGISMLAGRRVRMTLGRRRLARHPAPDIAGHTPRRPGLVIVPETLLHARVRLVSATLRHVGTGRWNAQELQRAARADPVTKRLAEADLLLCQAVDCMERYLDDLAKG
ncbi:hypothetical protein ACQP2E_31785 [Actinoplanes sp. CA-015351]|uniref:hypothetical protein n=1 Tax=Actinoplanes sp. CA-015351 TaxID=3239897 RepID=UPI003D95C70A